MLYPLTFRPIFKERIWGGRRLGDLYGKQLPAGSLVGESWEISDRPGDVSTIAHGPLAGRDLQWLVENYRADLLGDAQLADGRFPLLIKLLDAREKLSLQVHPPAHKATELQGHPKTEMWFIAEAAPGAELYAGLRHGVTRAEFERRVRAGNVADCFHRIPVRAGDSLLLPSGRVHAIGAGLVLFEIQQNSDTTYRVFDWDRPGLDGRPRQLHIPQSLASIDFTDFEPSLCGEEEIAGVNCRIRSLVRHSLFDVELFRAQGDGPISLPPARMQIIGVVEGKLQIRGDCAPILQPGDFCLLPACLPQVELSASSQTRFLRAEAH